MLLDMKSDSTGQWPRWYLALGIKHRTHQVPWKGAEEISVDMMVESEERGTRTGLRDHIHPVSYTQLRAHENLMNIV